MTTPELSRPVRSEALGSAGKLIQIVAEPQERAALANRFGLAGLDKLEAEVSVSRSPDENIVALGRIIADLAQHCVATQEPVAEHIDERFEIQFRPHPTIGGAEEELELGERELDVVFYDGGVIDVGEAVAETLALNLDPYPRAPVAAEVLKAAGVKDEEEARSEASPFAALAGLKEKLGK